MVGQLPIGPARGMGYCQKQLLDLKVSYGTITTCANICTIVSTNEREIREMVAILAVKKRFELYTDPIKIHLFMSGYCFLVRQVGQLHFLEAPRWRICTSSKRMCLRTNGSMNSERDQPPPPGGGGHK